MTYTNSKSSKSDSVAFCNEQSDNGTTQQFQDIYRTVFSTYPDVLDVEQVSELLGVSSKTVYRLLKNGELRSLKVGREYKIPKIYAMKYLKILSA